MGPCCWRWLKLFFQPALTLAVLNERQLDELVLHEGSSHQLHGERVREQRNAFQGFVGTAAAASPQRHAGWDEKMMRLPRQLPPHFHQSVPRLTATPRVNLQPSPHFSTFPGFWRVCRPPVSKLRMGRWYSGEQEELKHS